MRLKALRQHDQRRVAACEPEPEHRIDQLSGIIPGSASTPTQCQRPRTLGEVLRVRGIRMSDDLDEMLLGRIEPAEVVERYCVEVVPERDSFTQLCART